MSCVEEHTKPSGTQLRLPFRPADRPAAAHMAVHNQQGGTAADSQDTEEDMADKQGIAGHMHPVADTLAEAAAGMAARPVCLRPVLCLVQRRQRRQ